MLLRIAPVVLGLLRRDRPVCEVREVDDDAQAMDEAFASPEGKAVFDDAPHFIDMSRLRLLVGQGEEIRLPGAEPSRR